VVKTAWLYVLIALISIPTTNLVWSLHHAQQTITPTTKPVPAWLFAPMAHLLTKQLVCVSPNAMAPITVILCSANAPLLVQTDSSKTIRRLLVSEVAPLDTSTAQAVPVV